MQDAKTLRSYLDIIARSELLEAKTWTPEDSWLRSELHRQIFMNLVQGYLEILGGEPDSPDFTPIYNNHLLLQPNPDDTYVHTPVDGKGVYRLSGDRGTIRLLTVTLVKEPIGLAEIPGGQTAEYDLDDTIAIGADGRFECLLSAERPAGHEGNWLCMPVETDGLLIRRRSYDWANERDSRLAIERLDVSPLRPRLTQEQLEGRLTALAEFAERHSRQWLRYQEQLLPLVNRIEHHGFSDLGGIRVQQYWWGKFDFAADEALILETEVPETAPYWNIQLNDQIWNTLEYAWRQSHLNGHQARIDSDGKFRAVISCEDPGVPNWLDTVGRLQGSIVGRWYKCSSHPVPRITKVKLADVRQHLPQETPVLTVAEREDSIRARARAVQMRIKW